MAPYHRRPYPPSLRRHLTLAPHRRLSPGVLSRSKLTFLSAGSAGTMETTRACPGRGWTPPPPASPTATWSRRRCSHGRGAREVAAQGASPPPRSPSWAVAPPLRLDTRAAGNQTRRSMATPRAATLRTAGSVRKGGGSGALKLEALHRAHVRRIARFFIGFFRWSEIEVWDYHDFNWANDLLLLLSRICRCCFC